MQPQEKNVKLCANASEQTTPCHPNLMAQTHAVACLIVDITHTLMFVCVDAFMRNLCTHLRTHLILYALSCSVLVGGGASMIISISLSKIKV